MATKTLILRPVYAENATTEGSLVGSLICFPSDTENDQLHLLVNEIEADDDATYLGQRAMVSVYRLKFNSDSSISPTAMRVVTRAKVLTGSAKMQLFVRYLDENEESSSWESDFVTLSSEWTNYSYIVSVDKLGYVWSTIVGGESNFQLQTEPTDNNSKAFEAIYTQVYLEVDYDDGTGSDPVMHHKVSNTWEPVYGTVYNKVDGAWVEGTLDGLADGNSVTVVEV